MAATLSDVAALAEVSISAASRVLSDAPSARVRPETRERIRAAARDLGYQPNFAGRALKFARSNVIALIVPDLTNAIFAELMHGVEEASIAHDYTVLLGRSEDMQPGGVTISRLIAGGRVDGVLVQLGDQVAPADVEALLTLRAPVVFINSVQPGHVGSVALPDQDGADLATQHLIDLGHTRIGLIGGAASVGTAVDREQGFRAAMTRNRLPVDERWVTRTGYAPDQGRAGLQALRALPEPPTAVVVANLNAAIGVLAEARRLGVPVPDRLSVVAIHDAWTAEHTWPALTTVRMPLYQLGRTAIDSMFARLRGDEVGNIVIRDPAPLLIRRESTAPPPDDA